MEAIRENVKVTSKVLEKNTKCSVDSSVIVPDTKPDILKILQVDATSVIKKTTLKKGGLIVDGTVYITVLYLPEGDGNRIESIATSIDFNEVIDSSEIDEGMRGVVFCDVEQADISLLNSRKITARTVVGVNAEVTCDKEFCYISGMDSDEAAAKYKQLTVHNISAGDTCDFLIKDSIDLIAGKPQIEYILKCDTRIEDKEIRCVTNKVIIKGNVTASVLYISTADTVEQTEASMPFTEVFELQESCEAEMVNVWCDITEQNVRAEFDSSGEKRALKFEILVKAQMCVHKENSITYLTDCYYFGADTECEKETITAEWVKIHPKAVKNIRESISIDKRLPVPSSVYNVVVKPVITGTEKNIDGVDITSRLEVSVLYLSDNADNPVCCYKTDIPVIYSHKTKSDAPVCVMAECEHISYSLSGNGDIELRLMMEYNIEERREQKLEIITDVKKGDKSGSAGVVIIRTDKEEDLWEIGKKYRADCCEIAQLNDIDINEPVKENVKLLIPCR